MVTIAPNCYRSLLETRFIGVGTVGAVDVIAPPLFSEDLRLFLRADIASPHSPDIEPRSRLVSVKTSSSALPSLRTRLLIIFLYTPMRNCPAAGIIKTYA